MLTVVVRDSFLQIFSKMEMFLFSRQSWIHLWDCLDRCCCNGCDTEVTLRFKQLVKCPLSTSLQSPDYKRDGPHHNKERYLSKTTITNPVKVRLWSLLTLKPSLYLFRWPERLAWRGGHPCGDDDEIEHYHGYQLNDCWGQWYETPYCAVQSR